MKDSLKFLNAIRAFEAAAKHSSFVKAASELNVSHSVISQHVKNLEQWLDVKLFNRYGNRIELSQDGEAYIPHVNRGFKILRDASNDLINKTKVKTITVYAEPTIASRWLRRRLTAFSEANPYIDVTLVSAWASPTLKDSNVDVIINFETRLREEDETHHRLFSINGKPACSPQLLQKLTWSNGEVDFNSIPLVHDSRNKIWQDWYESHLPNSENWMNGKVYADLSLAIEAAVDGEGVIIADNTLFQREIESKALVSISAESIHCAWYSSVFRKGGGAEISIFQEWLLNESAC
ncbi:LysR family transcriptional regulator [Vibrio splendidus]|uniref:LysR family transcriptional regulator n=1 Tax=Vibrio splendidus TaxID=29497 RepID=UPI00223601AD|nr:LysR family transcriptional regulator [Vibrio splendidus]MCW4444169.1 LysR family transcriptional regulator [Vibrio splendidus]